MGTGLRQRDLMAAGQAGIPTDITSAVTREEATKLAELADGCTVLELGAHFGFSTVVLGQVAKLVCSVDTHQDIGADSWDIFQANIKRYGVAENVHPIRGRFEVVLPILAARGIMFDGCFIDGVHDAETVQRDLDLTVPLVRSGGFIAFHDYGRGPHNGFHGFGVTEVADAFGIDGVVGFLAWSFVK
jgi:predicted O-methyltransferase YrrM